MRTFHDEDEIAHIGRGLEARTLPKPEWTHAAHFAAAFWLLDRGLATATREMPRLIRAYNEATGVANTDTGGYHETITLASLGAAYAWRAARPHAAVHESLNALLASDYGRSDWPLAYWSRTLLFSSAARRGWVDPDVKALPFARAG
jgi:hypothetical protein